MQESNPNQIKESEQHAEKTMSTKIFKYCMESEFLECVIENRGDLIRVNHNRDSNVTSERDSHHRKQCEPKWIEWNHEFVPNETEVSDLQWEKDDSLRISIPHGIIIIPRDEPETPAIVSELTVIQAKPR
jgi:hypothetical protein